MKWILVLAGLTFSVPAFAKDCSTVKPFKQIGTQKAHVSVSRIFWTQAGENDEEICQMDLTVPGYDVRGREDDAYYCLKPNEAEVAVCKTTLNGEQATVAVVPASWIRIGKPSDVREYRFHSYINKDNDPEYFLDIFSRSLSQKLSKQSLIIEGALKTGPSTRSDGYFVRVEFKK